MSWRSPLAWLTVFLLAVGPLLASFHRASVRHAVCEHGDLIESEQGGYGDSSADDGSATSPVLILELRSMAALHAHAHCSVGILAKSAVACVPGCGAVAIAARVAPAALADSSIGYVRRILPNAPKTSPPSAPVDVPV